MSSNIAISVKNLSKNYQIYDQPLDRLKQTIYRGKKKFYREFVALHDVSFNIKKGETIGIIGKNGSGKSTLLQIIAGTLMPSSGEINVYGRVAALLELGSGFNPEFTGRENVYLNGAILGISKEEMENRIAAIEAFAEIGEFIDQPVKTYSSGMFVRLAFAVAINVDPDILIVDEALAVGDMRFQLKCIDKMKSFQKQGKTIIYVTHDIYSVKNFCTEVMWLMDGHIHLRGDVHMVVESYEDFMKFEKTEIEGTNIPQKVEKGILTIDHVTFKNQNGVITKNIKFGESLSIEVSYTILNPIDEIVGGVAIYDKQNTYICGLNTKLDRQVLPSKRGSYILTINYGELNLLPGTYYIDVGFYEGSAIIGLDYKGRIDFFRVYSGEYFAEGLTYLEHEWKVKEGNHHEI